MKNLNESKLFKALRDKNRQVLALQDNLDKVIRNEQVYKEVMESERRLNEQLNKKLKSAKRQMDALHTQNKEMKESFAKRMMNLKNIA